ncbi:MAG TPA: NUDIX hydrolase [Candidatus Nanoarchaeia archaeon]|nr:NUDIX hydrolase [Candidatus Nanoarchaeia archaeon]
MINDKVVVGIVNRGSTILMALRKIQEDNLSWVFPGGRLQSEETEKEAVIREVLEETGILCSPTRKLGERIHPNTRKSICYWVCDYTSGEISLRDPEITDAQWVQPQRIESIITSDLYLPVRQYLHSL